MVFGRPINLVLGAFTALLNIVVLVAKQSDPAGIGAFFTPEIILGLNAGVGAIVALIANQPPTVNAGDTIKIATPAGQPNAEISATIPPLEAQP